MGRLGLSVALIFQSVLCSLQADSIDADLSFSLGYRNDNLKWIVDSLPPSNIQTREKWKSLQSVQLGGRGETTIYNHLYLRGEGDYGFILTGNKRFEVDEIGASSEEEWLKATTTGNAYDVLGAIGYTNSFFSNQFQFTPLVGYSYSVQHFEDEHYIDTIHLLNFFENAKSFSTYQWMGPWIGLCFALQQAFKASFEYQFHWSAYRGKIHDNLVDNYEEKQRKNCGYGNAFILRVFTPEWKRWSIGLVGNYEFYWARNGTSKINNQTSRLQSVDWNSGGVSLNIERRF